jgi:hypothetical protein
MGIRLEVCVGEVFSRLTVESELPIRQRKGGGTERWFRCLCECGKQTDVPLKRLRSGKTRSCGCLVVPPSPGVRVRDPLFVRVKDTDEYSIYKGIKVRCYRVKSRGYSHYGERGICVCSGWRSSFRAFISDIGPRPSKAHSIDRINNDGNYSCGHCAECIEKSWPMNCRWATTSEQRRNRGDVVMLTFKGETMCITDWAKRYGMSKVTLWNRLNDKKMTLDLALTTLVRQFRDDKKFFLTPESERDHEWRREQARRIARGTNGT